MACGCTAIVHYVRLAAESGAVRSLILARNAVVWIGLAFLALALARVAIPILRARELCVAFGGGAAGSEGS